MGREKEAEALVKTEVKAERWMHARNVRTKNQKDERKKLLLK